MGEVPCGDKDEDPQFPQTRHSKLAMFVSSLLKESSNRNTKSVSESLEFSMAAVDTSLSSMDISSEEQISMTESSADQPSAFAISKKVIKRLKSLVVRKAKTPLKQRVLTKWNHRK